MTPRRREQHTTPCEQHGHGAHEGPEQPCVCSNLVDQSKQAETENEHECHAEAAQRRNVNRARCRLGRWFNRSHRSNSTNRGLQFEAFPSFFISKTVNRGLRGSYIPRCTWWQDWGPCPRRMPYRR